jgi:hypothetical protein
MATSFRGDSTLRQRILVASSLGQTVELSQPITNEAVQYLTAIFVIHRIQIDPARFLLVPGHGAVARGCIVFDDFTDGVLVSAFLARIQNLKVA